MNKYTLIYTVKDAPEVWQFVNVRAENADEAQIEFEDRHPDCSVIWINEGWDNNIMQGADE